MTDETPKDTIEPPATSEALEALKDMYAVLNDSARFSSHMKTIRAALATETLDLEALEDDIEQAITDTHEIDVTDRHYAKAVIEVLKQRLIK